MYKAAIVGAQGYAGRELARLLLQHPHIQLTAVYSRNNEWSLAHELPEQAAASVQTLDYATLYQTPPAVDILFLATPHEASLEIAEKLTAHVKWIIDLSGAFRLSAHDFAAWYQQPHTAEHLLVQAQYGLCPWQTETPKKIIANPGCYATAVLMALMPLAKQNLLEDNPIIIDAKSGISGAGRSAKSELLFGEIYNNFFPYKIGKHQHTPEIQHAIKTLAKTNIQPLLTTQVLPIPRGISASIYIPYKNSSKDFIEQVENAYQTAYKDYPLVHHVHLKSTPNKEQQHLLMLRSVIGSCRTHIAYQKVDDYLVIFSMLDNLLKGAASQAVENANRIFNLPLACGLEKNEGIL